MHMFAETRKKSIWFAVIEPGSYSVIFVFPEDAKKFKKIVSLLRSALRDHVYLAKIVALLLSIFESGMWQCFLKKQWNGKVPFHSGMLNRAGHVWRVSEEKDIGWWNQVFRGHMHQQVLGHCEFNKLSQMTDPWLSGNWQEMGMKHGFANVEVCPRLLESMEYVHLYKEWVHNIGDDPKNLWANTCNLSCFKNGFWQKGQLKIIFKNPNHSCVFLAKLILFHDANQAMQYD